MIFKSKMDSPLHEISVYVNIEFKLRAVSEVITSPSKYNYPKIKNLRELKSP